ncbi:MAG: hypothetical protein ACM3N5_15100 [Candidatus Eiseniibacteriota bacterium]
MDRPKRPQPTLTEKRKAEAAAREARLGEALRANLKRRRAQSAARAQAQEAQADEEPAAGKAAGSESDET